MALKAADPGRELIEMLRAWARERLPDAQSDSFTEFVGQFYGWVAADDLAERDPHDLLGAALSAWSLARDRAPGEVKLRAFNPEPEHDGWSSPHTIVEIVSDDMPFLVDSVTMELNSQGFGIELVIHPVIRVRRNGAHRLREVLVAASPEGERESVMHVQVTRAGDDASLERLRESLRRVLEEVRLAVTDWRTMLARLEDAREVLKAGGTQAAGAQNLDEMTEFLRWLGDGNFTFLGYREYDLRQQGEEAVLLARPESGLGILRRLRATGRTPLGPRALALAHAAQPLVLTKANSRSTIHRPAYLDYVGVKVFDEQGELVGERRFLGLYTTTAYRTSVREVPLLRQKVQEVLRRAAFPADSHDAKALMDILESYPRDSLFQMDAEQLFEVAGGILALGERQRVRLFITRDPLERFAECLVCIPRDRFNTENRLRVGRILLRALDAQQLDWSVQLSESVVARVHYILRSANGLPIQIDRHALEREVVRATRAWSDDLQAALVEVHGEARGVLLFRRYAAAFPAGYRSDWTAAAAVPDVEVLEGLERAGGTRICLYRASEGAAPPVRCKLFSDHEIALSDVLPTFEHMGARVVDERPHRITPADREPAWIYDFGLDSEQEHPELRRELFEQAFLAVLHGELEDDGLGALVLGAGLTGRQVTVIRAIMRYLRQAGLPFSNAYIQRSVVSHPDVAAMLVELFEARFHPERHDEDRAAALAEEIGGLIDAVTSLDEDRILRSFLSVVMATLRTNHFVSTPRPCLALKLNPAAIPVLPRPRPHYEIFVYSPQVEGVHLRGGSVARGGLRWSDRPEDFRTEVLGLMKAQMVKNALIVPVGSKGGFVVKRPPAGGERDALLSEGVACYRTFLSGLLDLTDNIVAGRVVPPPGVVRCDGDDPYLVVAADKGTATFSDIANAVSADYAFWLGDAFASGGSHGYDHKQMGITARGAWESVKRHFRELGRDIDQSSFTAVGVGDMSGDVFGNGMLLSRQTRLVAAFNHLHIFIDPDPDPERSFQERRRLFELPRSGWGDYDRALLSEGGAIHSRTAKTIPLSPQAQEALAVQAAQLSPNELISAILRAPVDLLWNGGIGTYVKASSESHAEVGDKANDPLRVDGGELRCKVVGEGGNLGFTQRGRIEYAARGGLINTDAIDNVAGVNCSDHEVNIKILLDDMVVAGELTVDARNALLVEMTDAVAERVIYASYTQTQAMSLELVLAVAMVDVHARLIRHLEQVAGLDRELEALPTEEALAERKADDQGLLAPELAILLAYCKIHLYRQLLESDLPDDEHLGQDLERYFPPPLGPGNETGAGVGQLPVDHRKVLGHMRAHRLRREIIATVVANQMVDRAGSSFVFRLEEETGASAAKLARGFAVAREVFDMPTFWGAVEALDNRVEASVQTEMLAEGRKLVERATRWLVRGHADPLEIGAAAARFGPCVEVLRAALPALLEGNDRETYEDRIHALRQAGVPRELGHEVAAMASLPPVFDIVEIAEESGCDLEAVTEVYFRLGSRVELDWLRERILELPRANRWQVLARAALRDDVSSLHRRLAAEVLGDTETRQGAAGAEPAGWVEEWVEANPVVERWLGTLAEIRSSRIYDTTTLSVALREVRNLVRSPRQAP